MISLKDIRYVRLGTSNLDDAVRYATKVLGLELVRRDGRSAYMRSDSRDHTLVYTSGDARDHAVAFELGSLAELDAAGAELDNSGYIVKAATRGECEQRWVDAAIVFADPSGNTIESSLGRLTAAADTFRPATPVSRLFPYRIAFRFAAQGRGILDHAMQCAGQRLDRRSPASADRSRAS